MAATSSSPSPSVASTSLLARLHPSLYLSHHLSHSTRPSTSSSPLSAPQVSINASPLTSSSSHPSPSSLIRYNNTTVICNITPTIVYPDAVQSSATNSNTLVPSITLTPLSSPLNDFKSGAPSAFAQSVTEKLFGCLDAALPFDKSVLDIQADTEEADRVRAKWCLFADCVVIGFDGALLEACFLAVIAALRQVHLPRAHFSIDDEVVHASPKAQDYWRLRDHMTHVPLVSGFGIYDRNLLTTPTSFESSLLSTSISIGLAYPTSPQGQISPPNVTSVQSTGPLVAADVGEDVQVLEKCVQLATRFGKDVVGLVLSAEAGK